MLTLAANVHAVELRHRISSIACHQHSQKSVLMPILYYEFSRHKSQRIVRVISIATKRRSDVTLLQISAYNRACSNYRLNACALAGGNQFIVLSWKDEQYRHSHPPNQIVRVRYITPVLAYKDRDQIYSRLQHPVII